MLVLERGGGGAVRGEDDREFSGGFFALSEAGQQKGIGGTSGRGKGVAFAGYE